MGRSDRSSEIVVGPMRLRVGDCRDVLAEMAASGDLADLLVTDPPYRLTRGGRNSGAMRGKFASEIYDNSGLLMATIPWSEMPQPIFAACKPDCDAYVMADSKNIFEARNAFVEAGWKFHELLNWKKESPSRTRYYMKNTEYILYLWKGRARDINNGGTTQHLPFPRPKDAIHATQKPVELLKVLIENSSQPGDLVLDPFAGSGSTLVAAMESGRRAIGVEVCPENAARAARWMQARWDAHRRAEDAAAAQEAS